MIFFFKKKTTLKLWNVFVFGFCQGTPDRLPAYHIYIFNWSYCYLMYQGYVIRVVGVTVISFLQQDLRMISPPLYVEVLQILHLSVMDWFELTRKISKNCGLLANWDILALHVTWSICNYQFMDFHVMLNLLYNFLVSWFIINIYNSSNNNSNVILTKMRNLWNYFFKGRLEKNCYDNPNKYTTKCF